MALIKTQSALAKLLTTEDTVLLLLFGTHPTSAAVHRTAVDEVENDFRLPGLVRDLSILTPEQKAAWSAADGHYAVVRDDRTTCVLSGEATELLRQDGTPSIQKIRTAFATGVDE